jgi:sorbitol-specific phosphotransferase system component IIC
MANSVSFRVEFGLVEIVAPPGSVPTITCVVGSSRILKLIRTRRAGALRRAHLLPVFAPCMLMRPANSAIIRLIISCRALL